MKSLQTSSTKKLLSQIPFNEYTNDAIDDFILEYVAYSNNNKKIINTILDQGMYNVFFRTQDEYLNTRAKIILLKSFITEQDAIIWIKTYGLEITEFEEYNLNQSIVLTIIFTNNDPFLHDLEENPNKTLLIAKQKYPTFAFNKEAYDMLLEEHSYMIKDNEYDEIIPYWVHYITPERIIQGMNIYDLNKLHSQFEYNENDKEHKRENVEKLKLFLKNPNKYIRNL